MRFSVADLELCLSHVRAKKSLHVPKGQVPTATYHSFNSVWPTVIPVGGWVNLSDWSISTVVQFSLPER